MQHIKTFNTIFILIINYYFVPHMNCRIFVRVTKFGMRYEKGFNHAYGSYVACCSAAFGTE